jgi:aspartyl protease family protein
MKFKFIINALIGLGLILLLVNRDYGQIWGIQISVLASVLSSFLWGAIITASLIYLSSFARYITIALIIIMIGANFYYYRYDLQDIGHRISFGMIPDSPYSDFNDIEVVIDLTKNNQFIVGAAVEGIAVTFLVDTGANSTVINYEDAKKIGIPVDELDYDLRVLTANGAVMEARALINNLNIGGIHREYMSVRVAQKGKLFNSLLGVDFLKTLKSYNVVDDKMIWVD